ncbi:siroheme synthase [Deinococcus koreensis]|uniref:precorrin-2 dehydrogenase n=1 Tax=Deinococcus koreensis TaxID=2054903 RepID=A0A2K3V2M3_9DEIO|nr:siroheme synthase [Deinococcus koreensis]
MAVFLELSGEQALIVGGGSVALRRARTLLEAGLQVRVVAPRVLDELAALPMRHEARTYRPDDVQGMRVVVAATDDAAVNDAVTADARAAGALVNHAGDAGQGTLRFPAVTGRAGVQVAIATGRELPMLAQALREGVEGLLPTQADLDGWVARREQALTMAGSEREAALEALRLDIRAAIGAGLADGLRPGSLKRGAA